MSAAATEISPTPIRCQENPPLLTLPRPGRREPVAFFRSSQRQTQRSPQATASPPGESRQIRPRPRRDLQASARGCCRSKSFRRYVVAPCHGAAPPVRWRCGALLDKQSARGQFVSPKFSGIARRLPDPRPIRRKFDQSHPCLRSTLGATTAEGPPARLCDARCRSRQSDRRSSSKMVQHPRPQRSDP
jgi:hypothetical protein